jgi:adenosylcobyric acid synthase
MRCAGVLPYLRDVGVDDEDSVALDESTQNQARRPLAADGWPVGEGPRVAILRLPRISNFTDFRPLEDCGLFRVRWVEAPGGVRGADLVVIPGSKSTVSDLGALRERGFDEVFTERRTAGTHFLGVCGGYQMLGERILDPERVESDETEVPGLGLLPLTTTFAADKVTEPVRVRGAGQGWLGDDVAVEGYEIHMGRSEGALRPLFVVTGEAGDERPEGAISDDGRVAGTYVHGLFDDYTVLAALARVLGVDEDRIVAGRAGWRAHREAKEAAYDRLAAVFREHLDMDYVRGLVGLPTERTPAEGRDAGEGR